MPKLNLPTVTLMCVDCVSASRARAVLEECKSLCDFAAVKLLTSEPTDYEHAIPIEPLRSLNDYSAFMLKKLSLHFDTPHVQIVQHDGWILDPEAWDPEWLKLDYIGPLFLQHEALMESSVGSGGFSLRSKALTDAIEALLPPWDGEHSYDGSSGNNWGHEDGVISCHLRQTLLAQGFRYGSADQAIQYAYGGNRTFFAQKTFGFHGFWPKLAEFGYDLTKPAQRALAKA